MITPIILIAVYAVILILIYAVSSAENVVFALSAQEIRELSERDDKSAKWLSEQLKKPRELALFFVVTKTLLTAGTAIILIFYVRYNPNWISVAISGILLWSTLILFEYAFPGTRGRNAGLDNASRLAPTLRFFRGMLLPVTAIWRLVLRMLAPDGGIGGPLAIEQELDNLIPDENGFASLESEEKEMIRHVVEFGETTVREVMVPRIDMICITAETSPEGAVKVIAEAGHSRVPVYEDRVDNIVGVLYAKDLLLALGEKETPFELKEISREPYFVPEAKRTSVLLKEFQENRIHMAVVVDEYGGTAGLVTLEDLIEEIVGEIQDEYDFEEIPIRKLSDNVYIVEARLPLDEINEALGIELSYEDADTLGGFIYGLAGAIPNTGDRFEFENLLFIVDSVVGQRLKNVRIVIKEPEEE